MKVFNIKVKGLPEFLITLDFSSYYLIAGILFIISILGTLRFSYT